MALKLYKSNTQDAQLYSTEYFLSDLDVGWMESPSLLPIRKILHYRLRRDENHLN